MHVPGCMYAWYACSRFLDPGRTVITYRQLDRKSSILAAWFLQQGLQPGDRLLAIGANCPEWLYLDVAAMKAGLLLIRGSNDLQSREILEGFLNKHHCKALVISPGEKDEVPKRLNELFPGLLEAGYGKYEGHGLSDLSLVISMTEPTSYNLRTVRQILESPVSESSLAQLESIRQKMKPGDPATTFCTSGSTGQPKIVVHSHQNLALMMENMAQNYGMEPFVGRFFNDRSFTWINSIAQMAIAKGITMVYVDTKYTLKEKSYDFVYRVMREERIAHAALLPYMLFDIISQAEKGDLKALASLRSAVIIGERPDEAILDRVLQFIPNLHSSYGSTETLSVARFNLKQRPLSGKPYSNVHIKVVDENDHLVPRGTVGEILVSSPMHFLCYLDLPEETELCNSEGGWFRTQDVGKMDDEGGILVCGRSSDVIARASKNVYPSDVEDSLMGMSGLMKCVAVGVPDPTLLEAVCVFVILEKDSPLTEQDIRSYAERNMLGDPALGFVPKYVEIVSKFPAGKTGKVDRRTLRDLVVKQHGLKKV